MKKVNQIGASLILLATSSWAALANGYETDCVVPAAVYQSQGRGYLVSFFSANTNAGGGNGGEIAVALDEGICYQNLEVEDKGNQVGNAMYPDGPVASDPGNSK